MVESVENSHANPLEVTAEDKKIAESLILSRKAILQLKLELNKQDAAMFPFSTRPMKDAAKRFVLSQLQVEAELSALINSALEVKDKILAKNPQPCTIEQLIDIQKLTSWLNSVTNEHKTHNETLYAHVQGFMQNAKGREELAAEKMKESLICPKHKKKAVGKSMDGKAFLCVDCVSEDNDKKSEEEKVIEHVTEIADDVGSIKEIMEEIVLDTAV